MTTVYGIKLYHSPYYSAYGSRLDGTNTVAAIRMPYCHWYGNSIQPYFAPLCCCRHLLQRRSAHCHLVVPSPCHATIAIASMSMSLPSLPRRLHVCALLYAPSHMHPPCPSLYRINPTIAASALPVPMGSGHTGRVPSLHSHSCPYCKVCICWLFLFFYNGWLFLPLFIYILCLLPPCTHPRHTPACHACCICEPSPLHSLLPQALLAGWLLLGAPLLPVHRTICYSFCCLVRFLSFIYFFLSHLFLFLLWQHLFMATCHSIPILSGPLPHLTSALPVPVCAILVCSFPFSLFFSILTFFFLSHAPPQHLTLCDFFFFSFLY